MQRAFVTPDEVRGLVTEQFGTARSVTGLDRVAGGTKKGVYRLRLDDMTTVMLYVWAPAEHYGPPSPTVPDDPFAAVSGADLFAVNHAALTDVGVRTPQLIVMHRDGRYLDADIALVEDVGTTTLEALMQSDPAAAAAPLAALGDALRRMHTTHGPNYGKVCAVAGGQGPQHRPAEDVILDRALAHLGAAAARDTRIAAAHEQIAEHVRRLHSAVTTRHSYGLVHGELGPDHVFVTSAGNPAMIDIEGLAYFDVEWEHAWLRLRFGDSYEALRPVDQDPHRLGFYRYAQVLSLIEGPLRIADTDFPDRQFMLDLAGSNVREALAAI